MQTQPSRSVLKKKFSENMQQIYKRTPHDEVRLQQDCKASCLFLRTALDGCFSFWKWKYFLVCFQFWEFVIFRPHQVFENSNTFLSSLCAYFQNMQLCDSYYGPRNSWQFSKHSRKFIKSFSYIFRW